MNGFILRTLGATLLVFGGLTAPTVAAVLIYNLDIVADGTAPSGTSPWIQAIVSDEVGPGGSVRLQMIATNLTGVERVDNWVFNLNPSLDPNLLNFAVVSSNIPVAPSITTGVDNQNVPGVMGFDIKFDFSNNPTNGLTGGSFITYDITSSQGPLTAGDFFFFLNSTDQYNSAAHIIGYANGMSGTIASVPEPGHAIFGVLLLGGLLWVERGRVQSFFRRRTEAT